MTVCHNLGFFFLPSFISLLLSRLLCQAWGLQLADHFCNPLYFFSTLFLTNFDGIVRSKKLQLVRIAVAKYEVPLSPQTGDSLGAPLVGSLPPKAAPMIRKSPDLRISRFTYLETVCLSYDASELATIRIREVLVQYCSVASGDKDKLKDKMNRLAEDFLMDNF